MADTVAPLRDTPASPDPTSTGGSPEASVHLTDLRPPRRTDLVRTDFTRATVARRAQFSVSLNSTVSGFATMVSDAVARATAPIATAAASAVLDRFVEQALGPIRRTALTKSGAGLLE